jgi:hypothetical protein
MAEALALEARIGRALSRGGSPLSVNEVCQRILDRQVSLLDGPEGGLILLELAEEGDATVLRVLGLDSELQEVDNYWLPSLDRWAGELKADYIQFSGRRGWTRYLKDHGWREVATVMRKEH